MQLMDRFGRHIDYLRVSVTDRCDLRCNYCLPKGFCGFEEPADWLTFDEVTRVIGAFTQMGVARVRLTGGEPLLRRNLVDLAQRLTALPGLDDLSLSTNATQLQRHALALRQAGVKRLNISLDTLDRWRMEEITGSDCLGRVLNGLDAARQAGFNPIKINMVVMPGVNETDVEDMVEFCRHGGYTLRLIETMPMGSTGQNSGFVDLQPVRERLRSRFGLVDALMPGGGPARYLRSADGALTIGFITPISQHFCETCNRVRLSVDGTLYLCLGQEHTLALRPLLRNGISDDDLAAAIRQGIELKPERHEFREKPDRIVRFMSHTGG